jgi:hypothetical protein
MKMAEKQVTKNPTSEIVSELYRMNSGEKTAVSMLRRNAQK